jgi:5-methylcytosine-specific restriction endonuclease McrA
MTRKETHGDDFNKDPLRATVDHKTPRSRGGKTNIRNCVLACRGCNCRKGDL